MKGGPGEAGDGAEVSQGLLCKRRGRGKWRFPLALVEMINLRGRRRRDEVVGPGRGCLRAGTMADSSPPPTTWHNPSPQQARDKFLLYE